MKRSGKNVVLSPLEFVKRADPLPPSRCCFRSGSRGSSRCSSDGFRACASSGWTYLALLALMIAGKAKNYYLAPIYPMLFAAGAVGDRGLARPRAAGARDASGRRPRSPRLVVVAAAPFVPAILPFLPPDRAPRVPAPPRRARLRRPRSRHEGPLEQRLGDQFGWPELVADVAQIYNALPPEERAHTGHLREQLRRGGGARTSTVPRSDCPRRSARTRTTTSGARRSPSPTTLIWLQWGRRGVEDHCRSVEQAGEHFHPWGMAEENRPIYLCRGLKHTIAEYWTPDFKHWN